MKHTMKALKTMCEWAAAQNHDASWGYQQILDRTDWSGPRRDAPEPKSANLADTYFKQTVDLAGDNPLGDLARALYEEREQIEWFTMYQSYHDEPRVKGLGSNYIILRLGGPRASWHADDLTTAVTIQGPNTWYPPHAHRQKEVYGIMGGVAEWQRGAEGWVERESGEIIYHPSGVRHETQTRDEPLLSFASWIDHFHLPSVFVWE
ncbi:MAG: hypothetical protein HQ501_03855 [Rhodospirillales bacterium]|nr:hypothetical protein [Rhodospirillales bacterium]